MKKRLNLNLICLETNPFKYILIMFVSAPIIQVYYLKKNQNSQFEFN
jgi:hypothetical protein